jgi:hypothetical protein
MKLNKIALLVTSLLATSLASQGAATLTFSAVSGATAGVLTNLAGSNGTVNQARAWGILVDTSGDGFKLGEYMAASNSMVAASKNVLSIASGVTDDVLYIAPAMMVNSNNATLDGGSLATGNLARPTTFTSMGTPNGSVGQAFMLVWFDNAAALGTAAKDGDKYGAFRLPSFTIPADGAAVSFAPNFVGVEPVRLADQSFLPVPEASTALLGALGALGLLRRRR